MEAFLTTILPIFSIVATGMLAARFNILDRNAAPILNRFVFFLAVPALLFKVVYEAPFEQFVLTKALGFIAIELIIFAVGAILGRFAFSLSWQASVLVGFTASFVNHVLLILPIVILLFGEDATPIVIILITFDAVVVMPLTTVIMDVLEGEKTSGIVGHTIKSTATNPHILSIALAFFLVAMGISFSTGLERFIDLLAAAAAPVALVSLGVVLSRPIPGAGWAIPMTVTALKLAFFPALVFGFVLFMGYTTEEARPALMVAAGPSGAMALVLATRYNLLVDDVARSILLTTAGALLTVTLTAAL